MRAVASRLAIALVVGTVATAWMGGAAAAARVGPRNAELSPACGPAAPNRAASPLAARGRKAQPASHAWQTVASWNTPGENPIARLVPWSDQRAALFALIRNRIEVARTSDGGSHWNTLKQIPGDTTVSQGGFDLAAVGHQIDYVHATRNAVVEYRTSPDGGRTWSDGVDLGRWGGYPIVQVARGDDGTVAVAWARYGSPLYQWIVRVSGDGGRTFGPEVIAGRYPGDGGCADGGPGAMALAVTRDSIVILFHKDHRLVSRRSTDLGATWSDPITVASPSLYEPFGFASSGDRLLVVIDTYPSLRARHSANAGRTWSGTSRISGASLQDLSVGRSAGEWAIAVARHEVLLYTHSADGVHWATFEAIATERHGYFTPFAPTTLNGAPAVPYYIDPNLVIAQRQ